jgi:hypothetical protein
VAGSKGRGTDQGLSSNQNRKLCVASVVQKVTTLQLVRSVCSVVHCKEIPSFYQQDHVNRFVRAHKHVLVMEHVTFAVLKLSYDLVTNLLLGN